ncbi:class I SAM-dependent methyltransferase [Thiopseudomonas alkaliphila]|uniref:class I SAM-dependent methyltransferase n=1 Tax=Thiopseudomonas alkaliphila TaxID=1697053 RepID=UPI002576735C|nr:class I SAM-dependent methyltransferase [Thiopseudomonas alkaliphila]MDM1707230.1 class I SAM-dependent methyltransferase [Thiopseudomonas alkaliphila]
MLSENPSVNIVVQALLPELRPAAKQLADQLALPLVAVNDPAIDAGFALQWGPQGLWLQELGKQAPGPVQVDFVSGAAAHRRQFGGGSGQMIAKAVGIQSGVRPSILDATAGLGRDAFVLACLECPVIMIERQPVVAALLADGLARAALSPEVAPIAQRMRLLTGDAISLMQNWQAQAPQVIHLDPMFPERDKSALVKKEMRAFKPIVGEDADQAELLAAALALASHRVVVKRPRKAPCIEGIKPSYELLGKSSRYDIYTKKSLKPTDK